MKSGNAECKLCLCVSFDTVLMIFRVRVVYYYYYYYCVGNNIPL